MAVLHKGNTTFLTGDGVYVCVCGQIRLYSAARFCLFPDVTLPSNLSCTSSSFEMEPTRFSRGEALRSPAPVKEVYQEMIQIYEKLQVSKLQIPQNTMDLLIFS